MNLEVGNTLYPTKKNPNWPSHWEFKITAITNVGVEVRDHNNNLDFFKREELKPEYWIVA